MAGRCSGGHGGPSHNNIPTGRSVREFLALNDVVITKMLLLNTGSMLRWGRMLSYIAVMA